MRAHSLQHVPFEGLGSIAPWLDAAGYSQTATKFYQSISLPDPHDVDLLIVMGGPMSVNDEHELPWLRDEKQFIRQCIDANKAVLGICLGAQLIASAMGSPIYKNRHKEIGWLTVEGVTGPGKGCFAFPPAIKVFHWHGETFDLPPGGQLLARSAACTNQAFQLGQSVIGLQFHLETTPESAKELVSHCREELVEAEYIQTEATILGASSSQYQAVNTLMATVLAYLTAR
ncbi:MAG: gamma-glutamyl-gamma-aminobutyrate hydrolase family protein [Desulforhopalus sp.]|nr:gamma-glutamyl-gamma-aminobutyrate hydrolase family protein [Desulforhopalus sp.]